MSYLSKILISYRVCPRQAFLILCLWVGPTSFIWNSLSCFGTFVRAFDKSLTWVTNVRLGLKWLAATNTLAYYDTSVTWSKSFGSGAPTWWWTSWHLCCSQCRWNRWSRCLKGFSVFYSISFVHVFCIGSGLLRS